MKKNIIFLILTLLCGKGVLAQGKLTIKGTVKGDLKGYHKIYVYGNNVTPDSAVVNNGRFEMSIPYKASMFPILYDEYSVKVQRGFTPYAIVVDRPGTVNIDDIDITRGVSSGRVSGMKSAADYYAFNRKCDSISRKNQQLLQVKYGKNVDPKSATYKAYSKELDSLNTEKTNLLILKYVKANPDSYTATFILSSEGVESLTDIQLENAYKTLSKRMQQSANGKRISDHIAGIKKSAVGQTVENFRLNTPDGAAFDFNQLKGKYVIIDFWASWCGPCRASFPHMKTLYQKYKSDRFEIYSISIDKSKSNWLGALKEEDLPWPQTLDTENISKSKFAVTGIPTTYLIDPTGKIMIKEVGFDSNTGSLIEKKIVELFGSK